ncbi:beta-ketoacyl synthase N-terminal-like domain-containing protein [Streptomyces coffeae]|uniref:Methyltransferase n=1 Tax=Streptomyces coffeae TaxID=621382 RepID=A0ABS1NKW4_9ACTN|nr:beta-ketoacyl synthase N-terminal-like domain-containing protein [Streptomyces coffeae]MBL1100574.1 methyltransferase [Streptomyces coffeae]
MSVVKDSLEEIVIRVLGPSREELAGATLQDLGLNSVNAVLLVEEINSRFDHDFPTSLVFEFGDIGALAAHIEARLTSAAPTTRTAPAASTATAAPARTAPAVSYAPLQDDVAIVGMSCRAAGANGPEELWDVVRNGQDCLAEMTDPGWIGLFREHFPGAALPRYGAMADTDAFDAAFFRISPREAAGMDPAQRLLLEESYRALEDAALDPGALRGRQVAVVIGSTGLPPQADYSAHATMGADSSIMAARLAYHLDTSGPALALDTACSSSLVALDIARRMLQSGEAELALAGGVQVFSHPGFFVAMESLGTTSPTRRCSPFDQAADGMLLGEGVGVLVLKRLADAVRDRDRILGVIRGSGTNQDGRTAGITAPSYLAQSRLMQDVYRRNGIEPTDIQYVEAHGTGTKLGDPVEIHGLTDAFTAFTDRTAFCAIGSVKANIGHTTGAAGVLGVIKVLLALRHRTLPPAANFRQANQHINFAGSAVRVTTEPAPWPRNASGSRLAAVSAFGYSGTNAHLVIEEYAEPEPPAVPAPPRRPQLIPLSARDETQLHATATALVAELRSRGLTDRDLTDVAWTLQIGREAMEERLAVIAGSMAECIERLAAFADGGETGVPGLFRGRVPDPERTGVPAEDGYGVGVDELAAGWCEGRPVDWARLHTGTRPRRLRLPGHSFERTRFPRRTDFTGWGAAASAAVSTAAVAPQTSPSAAQPAAAPAVPSVLAELDTATAAFLRANPDSTSLTAAGRVQETAGRMQELCRHMLLATFQRMGVFTAPCQRYREGELASRLEVVSEHAILFGALLGILTDAGFLRVDGEELVTTDVIEAAAVHTDEAALERRREELAAAHPEGKGFLNLVATCLDAYPDVLAGRRKAQEVLFAGGSFDAVGDVYHSDQDTNSLIATLVAEYVRVRLERDPQATVSILEVGAGTGSTSARVLPALDPYASRVRYVYTDISRSFTQFGSRQYGTTYPFTEFAPLDVERPPAEQDFTPETFDLVLANNVLHATSRIDRSLTHIRQALRPGGLFVLMEATLAQDAYTLTFGLTSGWWTFEDDCRLPGSPLLTAPMWRITLEHNGFGGVRALSLLPFREDQAPESVILAEKTAGAPADASAAAPACAPVPAPDKAVGAASAPDDTPGETPAPEATGEASPESAAPGGIEGMVAAAWQDVLGLRSIAPDDDFQRLGGDSILATQIISRLKNHFPVELDLGSLFEARTVADMARLVEGELVERIDELPEETVVSLLA